MAAQGLPDAELHPWQSGAWKDAATFTSFSSRPEALMGPNVHCDSEQEARDCTTATMPSPFMAVPAVEPKPMDYEEWRVQVRSVCGAYSPEGADPKTFAGSIRPVSVWGCEAVVTSCNIHRMERTTRDVRLDGMEHYYAMLYLAGRTTVIQNDRLEQLDAGDIGLMDSTQPVTYIARSDAYTMHLRTPRPVRSILQKFKRAAYSQP
jgi:hypothetical protein